MPKVEPFQSKTKWGWRLRKDDNTIELTRAAAFASAAAALDNARADGAAIIAATAPAPAPGIKTLTITLTGADSISVKANNFTPPTMGRDSGGGLDPNGPWSTNSPTNPQPFTVLVPTATYIITATTSDGTPPVTASYKVPGTVPIPPPDPAPAPLPVPAGVLKPGGYFSGRVIWDVPGFAQTTGTGKPYSSMTYTYGGYQTIQYPDLPVDQGGPRWTEFVNWLKSDPKNVWSLSAGLLQDWERWQWDNTLGDSAWPRLGALIQATGVAKQFILPIGWEMNGWYGRDPNGNPYGFQWGPMGPRGTPEWTASMGGFKRVFNRRVGLFKQECPDARVPFNPNGFPLDQAEEFWPGGQNVDGISMNHYLFSQYIGGQTPGQYWANVTKPMLEGMKGFAIAKNKPVFGMNEWATNVDGYEWPANVEEWFRDEGGVYTMYFDTAEGGVGKTLKDLPEARRAVGDISRPLCAAA